MWFLVLSSLHFLSFSTDHCVCDLFKQCCLDASTAIVWLTKWRKTLLVSQEFCTTLIIFSRDSPSICVFSLWHFHFLYRSTLNLTVCPTQIFIFLGIFQSLQWQRIMRNSSHLAWSFPPKLLAVVWGDGLSAEFENWQHTSISPPSYKTKQKPPSVCGFGLTGWMFLFRGSGAHWNIYFQTILLSQWRDTKLTQFLPTQVSQKRSRWNIPPLWRSAFWPCLDWMNGLILLTRTSECSVHCIIMKFQLDFTTANQIHYKYVRTTPCFGKYVQLWSMLSV